MNRNRQAHAGLLLLLGAAAYLYPFVRVLWRSGDEGTLVYGAQRVAEGALPYRDFFEVMGPGSFYWLGLFFKIFGVHWWVARGLLLLTSLAVALLLYWLTRRLDRSRSAFLPAACFLIISMAACPATNHHLDSNLFALLAVAVFSLWQDRQRKAFLLLAGAAAGITSCCLQQKGLFLFLALLPATLISDYQAKRDKGRIFSHLGLLTAGYAGVGCLVLFYFYGRGGLQDLLYANLIWPLSNYHKVNLVPYGYYLFESIRPLWETAYGRFFSPFWALTLSNISLLPYYLIYALPIIFILLIIASSFDRTKRAEIFNHKMISYIIIGAALWISEIHRKDMLHLIYGSPLMLITLFLIFKQWLSKKKMLFSIITGIITLGFFIFGIVNIAIATSARQKITTRVGNIYCATEDKALEFLLKNTKPGEPVFIYPYYPMYYFLADVRNPTRYSILIYQNNTRAQFREVIEELEKAKVKYVLWDTYVTHGNLSFWFPEYHQPPENEMILEKYLLAHYDLIMEQNNFRILQRRQD